MATAFKLPTAATPVERILSRFDRQQIESFIEIAIGLLDVANDPDLEEDDPTEANGDELDHSGDESDWSRPEWRQRGGGEFRTSRHEQSNSSVMDAAGCPEDAEEDDGCEDGDPDTGADDSGEETYIARVTPKYGDDQSLGPINRNDLIGLVPHAPEMWR
jgi:hypothetical protein